MSGYQLEMNALLEAMKNALLGPTSLPYLSDVRIASAGWFYEPWATYTVYLSPLGSPETIDATDGGTGVVKHVLHVIAVDCVKLVLDAHDEGEIVGRDGAKVGIATFVSDVAGFLEANLLGIDSSLIDYGVPPVIEFADGAYAALEADTDIWLLAARGRYSAKSRSFTRLGTYP